MTYTEIGVIVLAVICIIIGLTKGMAKQFIAIVHFALLVLGTVFAVPLLGWLFDGIFPTVAQGIDQAVANLLDVSGVSVGIYLWYLVGFILVYIVCYGIVHFIKALGKLLSRVEVLKKLDKVLGAVFSLGILYVLGSALLAVVLNLDVFARLLGITSDLTETISAIKSQINGGAFLYGFTGKSNFIGNALIALLQGL